MNSHGLLPALGPPVVDEITELRPHPIASVEGALSVSNVCYPGPAEKPVSVISGGGGVGCPRSFQAGGSQVPCPGPAAFEMIRDG